MSAPFKVGEIVITQHLTQHPELNGTECEVIEGLAMRAWECAATAGFSLTYKVRWPDGDITVQSPHELRRRKPPSTGEQSVMQMFVAPQRVGETV